MTMELERMQPVDLLVLSVAFVNWLLQLMHDIEEAILWALYVLLIEFELAATRFVTVYILVAHTIVLFNVFQKCLT